jgi:hypothetical protein
MVETLKLLAVFPHPDDETLGLGSTLARYHAEGIETYLVCATRGERGWFDSEGPDPGLEAVGRIRETRRASASARTLSSANWKLLNPVTQSNEASGHGNDSMSPTRNPPSGVR